MFFLKALPSREMVDSFADQYSEVQTDDVLDALGMMRNASVLVRQIDQYFAEKGLSQLKFLILMVVSREPERDSLRIQEILDRIDVSKPVMTRTLNGLEKDGLISMVSAVSDKRGRLVSLSTKGRKTFDRVLPGYFLLIAKFMGEADV